MKTTLHGPNHAMMMKPQEECSGKTHSDHNDHERNLKTDFSCHLDRRRLSPVSGPQASLPTRVGGRLSPIDGTYYGDLSESVASAIITRPTTKSPPGSSQTLRVMLSVFGL